MVSAAETVAAIHAQEDAGDVLVFMPGQDEIERTCELLADMVKYVRFNSLQLRRCFLTFCVVRRGPNDAGLKLNVMPMYAGLPIEDQMRVFDPPQRGQRRVIVATNIAETSVTIPNIAFVVDAGFVKVCALLFVCRRASLTFVHAATMV